jgi:hypothetical protein
MTCRAGTLGDTCFREASMRQRLWTLVAAIALLAAACQPVSPSPAAPTEVRGPTELRPTWPPFGEAVEDAPLLQWESFPGATHYQVAVLDGDAGVILQQDTTYPLFRVSPPLPKGTRYAWNVQAQDADHTVLAELNSQFSVKSDLILVWPPDREAVDSQPVLQWQGFTGADHYQVWVLNDEVSPPELLVDQVVNETSYAVSTPLAPGSYTWTVRALDGSQAVIAELNSQFRVIDQLAVLEPADGAAVGASPTIRWTGFPGATQYQVLVLEAEAYPPVVVVDSVSKGTQFSVNPPLKPETSYSLTIRAMNRAREVLAESNTAFSVYAAAPFFDCSRVHVLAPAECEVLVTLYQETGGPTWASSADWLANDTPCEWSGVTCTDGHVTDLNLFFKALKGSPPAALAELPYLRVLALRDNQLTGPIPPELGRLEQLVSLDLSRNQLSGNLPSELSGLQRLEFLFLYANQLSGELPPAWGSLPALRHLDLGYNALTGAIPAEFGQLQTLEALRVGHNQLSGSLPAELGLLSHLTEADVSYNQLSGAVPEAWLRLPYRALWGNQLAGTIVSAGAPPMAIDFQGVSFVTFSSLGASVWPEVLPAVPPLESAPFWEARPEHLRFTFAGAPEAAPHLPLGAALSDQAQLLIYPASDYQALDRNIRLAFGDLRDLLEARPAAVEGSLPLLPLTNASQVLHARLHYLDFANGTGVGYLMQYAMGPSPINNQELFYTFQGLTTDRAYVVAAFFPVRLPGLPATAQLSEAEFANLVADYPTYLANTTAMLEAQAPGAFTPDLATIDRMLQSLVVHGENP